MADDTTRNRGPKTVALTRPKRPAGGRNGTKAASGAANGDHPEAGVALALLKYFYWIEIGIRSYLRSQDEIELSRSEGLVIASIMLGYSRPSDIARQQGVSRQATHATIRQMRVKGMVEMVPDPTDGRIKLVALTPLAHKMNADGVVAMEYLWQELAQRVGQTNLNRLATVLHADWGPPIVFGQDDQDSRLWR